MAELALAASIIQVITFTLHNTGVFLNFVEGIKNAPRELQSLRQDTHALERTLQAIDTCTRSGIIRDTAMELLRESLLSCGQNLKRLHSLLARFIHKHEWNSAFMWRFKRDEIQTLRNSISHSKQTLGLSLAVVQAYAIESGNRRLSRKIEEAIRPIKTELSSFYEKWLEWQNRRRHTVCERKVARDCQDKDPDRELARSIIFQRLSACSHPWANSTLDENLSLGTS
ncbi:MAG: hypothetical protein Q9160_007320, partial [Pyrenula sp. 1 TL-2023]